MEKNQSAAKKQGKMAINVTDECLNCGDERMKKKI